MNPLQHFLRFFLLPGLCIISTICRAQDFDSTLTKYWGYNTALTMPAHKWESGIAQPFRYGINEKLELRSNALEIPFLPNAGLKVALGKNGGNFIATEHLIGYPTVFLNTVSMKGTGGLISPEFAPFPTIVSLQNNVLVSRAAGSRGLMTLSLGYTFAIRSGKPDPNATIDLPLVYPRMANYYEGSTIRLGFGYKGIISKKFLFDDGVESFFVIRHENNFFFENTGAIMWIAGGSFRIRGGYSLSYGKYPYGTQWQLWPSLDIIFGSKL
ncbi:MAG: hypothetical protein JST14_16820 [Bacteroidetes bacterium]|nr:hypothetical protein [Bacteroidota bacterium]